MSFLHGAETIEVNSGARPVTVVKSGVIGLLGIAPSGPINTPTQVLNPSQAAQFGDQIRGYNIPYVLDQIFKQGNATVIVVNIFDPEEHIASVADEVVQLSDYNGKTAFAPVGSSFVLKNTAGTVTYVKDTDYTVDQYGNIEALETITANQSVKATYSKIDTAAITASALIGTIDGSSNARTGSKCFDLAYTLFGYNPKIIIAPGYSSLSTLSAEMIVVANKFRAVTPIDAPLGTTPAVAIAGRGPAGAINFNTSSERAILLYPHLKALNPDTDEVENFPYSAFFAGIMSETDNTEGYWTSPSNHEIKGIVGVERDLSFAINDANTEVNSLNAVGITTVANSFGSGIRTWGNRSAAFPSETGPKNFINVRRTADVVHESLELSALPFMDKTITNALIDSIAASGQDFINTLIGRGALLTGSKLFYNPDLNPALSIAAGNLRFSIKFMVGTPLEKLTYESFLDVSLLSNLGGQ